MTSRWSYPTSRWTPATTIADESFPMRGSIPPLRADAILALE